MAPSPASPGRWTRCGRWRCFRDLDGPDPQVLTAVVEAATGGGGRLLKDDRRSRVVRVEQGGAVLVVKRYHLPAVKRHVYGLLRVSPAWREWRGGRQLANAGRRSAPAVGLVCDGRAEWLVLPWVEGRTLADLLRDGGDGAHRLALARRLGEQAGRLAAAGWVNRDYKPTNLVVDAACRAGDEPVMIDAAGVVRRRSDRQALAMLALLHRAARQAGHVRRVEAVACLRAMLDADPSLLRHADDRLRAALRQLNTRT